MSVKEPRSDDSVTDRLRFLMTLCLVALGAAAFAIAFRSSLTLWYRMVLGASNVVEAIARLPRWMRVGLPAVGGAVAGADCQTTRHTRPRRQQRHGGRRSRQCAALAAHDSLPCAVVLVGHRHWDVNRTRRTAD